MTRSALAATFEALQRCGYEPTAVELAEILWLARYLPSGRSAETPSDPVRDSHDARPSIDATSRETEAPAPPAVHGLPPADDSAPPAGLFAHVDRATIAGPTRPAALVRAPAAPALPGALSLSRALRPLLKRRTTSHRLRLDEDATADASAANFGRITPVFRPGAERWFEVALVVDDSASMQIWKEMTAELHQLLVRHGGFRDLRRYRLRTDDGQVALISASNRRVDTRTISDPSGHRLIILVTDAVSEVWQQPQLRRALFDWGRFSPVVLLHVLPRRMWPHTAVGLAEHAMHPLRAGAATADWWVGRGRSGRERAAPVVQLPVMTLDAVQFGQWARTLMQVSAGICTGTLLGVDAPPAVRTMSASEELTARERIQRFRAVASPEAYQLACYFATRPLTLPVMRIVQRQMMPATGTGQLAEFLLGGLIYQVGAGGDATGTKPLDPEATQYEFYPGVRDILLDQIQEHEAARIVRSIEEYLSDHLGESVKLQTLVPDEAGKYAISASAMPFVVPGIALLERMGVRPRPAAPSAETERLLGLLHRHFGETRMPRQLEQNLRALRASPDEQRSLLFSTAVELMPAEPRERLLPLGVTESAPPISPGPWRQLLDWNGVAPLEEMGGLSFDEREQLTLHPDLRSSLREQVAASRIGSLHAGLVDAYRRARALPGTGDRYYYTHFMKHVAAAGDVKLAEELLFDTSWIASKIQVQRVPQYLDDLKRFPGSSQIQSLYEVAAGKYQQWEDPEEWAMSLLAAWEDRGRDAAEQDAEDAQTSEIAPATSIVGNIYKGRVSRVQPELQASFVDLGLERDGFLHVSDVIGVAEEFERREGDGEVEVVATQASKGEPRIEDLLREGQEILVQVTKEPLGTRGARLTSDVTIPGRFLLFMPTAEHVGVSREIESREERRRLRGIVREFRESHRFTGGVIIRSAASGRPSDDIISDLQAFQAVWTEVRQKLESSQAPVLVYREASSVVEPTDPPTEVPHASVLGWVLVTGVTTAGIQSREAALADGLGRLLAERGYGLITGDFPGVDMSVTGRFEQVLRGRKVNIPDVLLYLTRAQKPTYSEGTVVAYSTDREFMDASLYRADAVVVIGSTPFLKELATVTVDRLIPLVSITTPAAGSDSFVVRTTAALTARTQEDELDQSAVIDHVGRVLHSAVPAPRLRLLAEQYLRSSASNVLQAIEYRISALWPRASFESEAASDRPDVRLLRAIGFRRTPDAGMLRELTQDDESMHVVLQRMLSLKWAIEDSRMRPHVPSDLESRLTPIFRAADDGSRLGALASQVRTFLAQELLPLAKVVTMVDRAGRPDFEDTDAFIDVAEPLSDHMARELLGGYEPGWRMAGLARAASRPLDIDSRLNTPELAEGSERSLSRTVRAILGTLRYESTFAAHVTLAVRALVAISRTGIPADSLTAENRVGIEQLGRVERDHREFEVLRSWLNDTPASPAEDTGSLGQATEIRALDLGNLPELESRGHAFAFARDEGKDQAAAIGSTIMAFARGTSAESRYDVARAVLLAHLVAKKKVPKPNTLKQLGEWNDAYVDVLANIGMTVMEGGTMKYETENQPAVRSPAESLVGAVALMSVRNVETRRLAELAIEAVRRPSEQDTLRRLCGEAESETAARYQVSILQADEQQRLVLTSVALCLKAKRQFRGALFEPFDKRGASASYHVGRFEVNAALLAGIRDALSAKLEAFERSYILPIGDLSAHVS